MTKQDKKAPILLTETESDHVAGGDNGDPFNQIAQLLKPAVVGRQRRQRAVRSFP